MTGISDGDNIRNLVSLADGSRSFVSSRCTGTPHAGTGDVFASIIAADCVNGVPLEVSVRKAADFVGRAIAVSDELQVPAEDGVCFEEILGLLI